MGGCQGVCVDGGLGLDDRDAELLLGDGLRAQTQEPEGVAEQSSDFGFELGFVAEAVVDVLGGSSEDVDHADFVAVAIGGCGLDHVDEQVVLDGVCAGGLTRGTGGLGGGELARVLCSAEHDESGDQADDQGQEDAEHTGDEDLVALGELGELVGGARGACVHGLAAEEAFDIGGELCGGLVSAGDVLLERAGDDGIEIAGEGAVEGAHRGRVLLDDDAHGLGDGAAGERERQPTGEQFVGDGAQRVDIASGVDLVGVAGGLLGAHVRERADDLSGVGAEGVGGLVGAGGSGDAEVQDLGLAERVGVESLDENVAGLEVAVDESSAVGVLDGLAESDDERQPVIAREGELVAVGLDVRTGDELHGEIGLVSAVEVDHAGLVDLGDARVLELAEDLGFSSKSLDAAWGHGVPAHDLESDGAARALLDGLVDDAHAAAAEFALDPESGDVLWRPDVGHGDGLCGKHAAGAGVEFVEEGLHFPLEVGVVGAA